MAQRASSRQTVVPTVRAPIAMSAEVPVPSPARLAAIAQQADSLTLDKALPAILDIRDGSVPAPEVVNGGTVEIVLEDGVASGPE